MNAQFFVCPTPKCLFLLTFLFVWQSICGVTVYAKAHKVEIDVDETGQISVRGRIGDEKLVRLWRFPQKRLHIKNLLERLEKLTFYRNGDAVNAVSGAVNSFETETETDGFSFEIKQRDIPTADAAFVTWANKDGAQILFKDLLPVAWQEENLPLQTTFKVPLGWRVYSSEESLSANEFAVRQPSDAFFVIGADWREIISKNRQIKIFVKGKRTLSDAQILACAESVAAAYQKIFGEVLGAKTIFLAPYSQTVEPSRWSAETFGANIRLLSGDSASETTAFNRLHEQLRHEFFHFYFPHGVRLSGAYDWFYEGFALYISLKIGVREKIIRFEDFLDTLSKAFWLAEAFDRKALQTNGNVESLANISHRRFENASNETANIYAKALFVAFMFDLAILSESRNSKSLETYLRQIISEHGAYKKSTDAETVIRETFRRSSSQKVLEKYAFGGNLLEIEKEVSESGIESGTTQGSQVFRIKNKLSGRQKDLLHKLGYNPR